MRANRLAGETSPYLLQHAHNPVDWYPWGPEALERARTLDRPIFLSIGYAACHWCHVMERELFEDPTTAAYLDEHFVAIKVDREERPDLDAVYMDAVQAMTGSGGWPMSVFLAPDGRPFYGGTYFPNTRRHGMPAFLDVLEGVASAWRERRGEVESSATSLAAHVARSVPLSDGEVTLDPSFLDTAVGALEDGFDALHGGWGSAPKFPQPMAIDFLLRRAAAGDPRALPIAGRALERMAAGGIFDQLAGGFARYATDAAWLVPHFEKMLYDNAQLARVYLHAWALTCDPAHLRVATATLDFVAREMTLPDGVFGASLDADTGGEEGATYTWTADEVREVLDEAGLDQAWPLVAEAYDVTQAGNWEGRVILRRVATDTGLVERYGRPPGEVADLLERAPAFLDVLEGVASAWRERRGEVESSATSLAAHVARSVRLSDGEVTLDPGSPRHGRRGPRGRLRRPARRLGQRPEVPHGDGPEFLLLRRAAGGCMPESARWPAGRSTGWRRAGSSTSSAAASPATAPMPPGQFRTSRRCSTTTRCWCRGLPARVGAHL